MKIKLAKSEIIHFVGIGGIGMSGLSLIMKGKGFKIQGSDISTNKNIERLKKEKIKVLIGHKKQNINKATILVVSSAIKKNNPELMEAKKRQLPIYKRGEMLANIVSLTKNIVVVGSHGKTTTTSLIASIFQETKIDPTIINGGVINSINNSAKLGKSDWSILEADESDGSFVYIPSTYSIITNIDREHMDYYRSMNELNSYFLNFVKKVPSFGKSFICLDDKNNKHLISEYIDYHKKVWPEIIQSIRNSGINSMEIYNVSNRLFMIAEVSDDFTLESKKKLDQNNPKVQEWENLMWKYQKALPFAEEGEKWVLMNSIFKI